MPVLDCSVKSCYFNADNKCSLEAIKVEGKSADYSDDTACANYKMRAGEQMTNGCCNKSKDVLKVACSANKCVFNENNQCKAEHIGIAGANADNMDDTECASFVCRDSK